MIKNLLITQPWPCSYVTEMNKFVDQLEYEGFNVIIDTRTQSLTETQLIETLPGIFAHIAGTDCYTQKVMDAARDLKIICRIGVGVDNIDIPYATKKGIVVTNTPGTGAETVAEYTFSLMLALTRKVVESRRVILDGEWHRSIGRSIYRKILGIIGIGNIGRQLAKIVSGFDMKVIAYDPYIKQIVNPVQGIELVKLDELLQTSDYISVHVPYNSETKDLINARELSLMKTSAIILNTSRGGIINEDALYQALKNKTIDGAALDVFCKEPPDISHPIFSLDNILVSSHNAGTTYEGRNALMAACVEAVINIVNKRKTIGIKNPELLDTQDFAKEKI